MSIDKQRMNVGSAATLYTDIEIYRQIRYMTYTYIAYREAVGPIIGRQRAPHPDDDDPLSWPCVLLLRRRRTQTRARRRRRTRMDLRN